jgi:predicted ATP-dependent protease
MVEAMSRTRAERAEALEVWTNEVASDDLVEIDTDALKAIAEYSARRDQIERALAEAVHEARATGRSWSEIGTMLGVSKQAAQRKYSKLAS